MRAFIFRLNLLCLLAVCLFACDHRSSHPVLHRADSLLKARQPDSAMILLKSLPSAKRLPKADRAYYAILLAAATDKLELPLLPCDTLLNFALDYYSRRDYERAWALLYKGRLLAQMDDEKAAIEHSLEALEVLQDFPEDTICRRLIYSSLGLWYEDCMLYDKALEVLEQSLQYSLDARDSAIAYNNINSVYIQRELKDSAIFYQQKAVDYAASSRDTILMINYWHNLSMCYTNFNEIDSAMFYAQAILQHISSQDNNCKNYFYTIGDLYLERGEYDSARYYLEKSLSLFGANALPCWSLAELEYEQGNYKEAYEYFYKYALWQDSLFFTREVTEVQHLVYKHQTEMEVHKERVKARDNIGRIVVLFVMVCFVIILVYQHRVGHKEKQMALSRQKLEYVEEKLKMMQQRVQENEDSIALLQGKGEEYSDEIGQKEQLIAQLQKEIWGLRTWLFQQTPIYKKVIALSNQKDMDKKSRKVMTEAEHEKLKKTIFEIYADYISAMQTQYPRLTDDDLLLLCLQEADIPALTIALCFGYSDTSTINQRKSRLRVKMS